MSKKNNKEKSKFDLEAEFSDGERPVHKDKKRAQERVKKALLQIKSSKDLENLEEDEDFYDEFYDEVLS